MFEFVAEAFGTMILIIFGGGVVANVNLNKSKAQNGGWIVVAIGWGLGVMLGVYAIGQFTGAHLNPAVTLSFALIGEFSWGMAAPYIAGQLLGAFLGGVVVYFHFLQHFKATDDPNVKLGVFATDPAIPHPFSNVLSEFIGTAVLIVGLLTIGANDFSEGLNPLIVGLLITAIGISLGGPTGYAINPARDLGPRIAHFLLPIEGKRDSNWQYAWIPIVGPITGGMFGACLYQVVFTEAGTALFIGYSIFTIIFLAAVYFIGERAQRSQHGNTKTQN